MKIEANHVDVRSRRISHGKMDNREQKRVRREAREGGLFLLFVLFVVEEKVENSVGLEGFGVLWEGSRRKGASRKRRKGGSE